MIYWVLSIYTASRTNRGTTGAGSGITRKKKQNGTDPICAHIWPLIIFDHASVISFMQDSHNSYSKQFSL